MFLWCRRLDLFPWEGFEFRETPKTLRIGMYYYLWSLCLLCIHVCVCSSSISYFCENEKILWFVWGVHVRSLYRVKRTPYYVSFVVLCIYLLADLLTNLWYLYYYHYRFPLFFTKSASDSVVLTHLNSLSGNSSISAFEKKFPKLFVMPSPVHASHHSLSPGLSSITTAIPGASSSFLLFLSVCLSYLPISHAS